MREVEFEALPATGSGGEPRRGSLVDLLRTIPYLLALGLVPPHAVLNDLLARGYMDAGMSGAARWKPFALTADDWAELAALLESQGLTAPPVPDWVLTMNDWHIWVMEHRFGVPAEEHRRLMQRVQALQADREAARDAGHEARFLELHIAAYRADQDLADFVGRYLRTSRS